MKIAVLGTLHKPISSSSLGGTETFTYYLVEDLVRSGHDVTLFAHPDSKTSARLISTGIVKEEMHIDSFWPNQLNSIKQALELVEGEGDFDIVHGNLYETYPALPFASLFEDINVKFVSTVHNDLFAHDISSKIFEPYKDCRFVFVSKFALNQAAQEYPNASFIYNGIAEDIFRPIDSPKRDYVLWLSRISEGKGLVDAIMAAKKANIKIIFAGGIDSPKNQLFFDSKVKPLVDDKQVIYAGAVSEEQKLDLYQNALAFLFPVKWDEPFGLVSAEAMACGTPVVGYRRGALPEVIKEGETGYLVDEGDISALAEMLKRAETLDRSKCRSWVEQNFTTSRTSEAYIKYYNSLLGQ